MPNKLLYRIDPGSQGSSTCCFSPQGTYLAVACIHLRSYPIRVYDVLTGDRVAQLDGHQDLVYQLCWLSDDSELLSVSSDGSARTWLIQAGSVRQTSVMQHPTFVYSGAFQPNSTPYSGLIATGAYDGIVRLWSYDSDSRSSKGFTKPNKTLLGHESNVNAVLFDQDGGKLFTGDAQGVLKIWSNRSTNPHPDGPRELFGIGYECIKSIDMEHGHPIQYLQLHSSHRKVLVHCADQTLHCLDTRIYRFLTHFKVPHVPEESPFTFVGERKYPFARTIGPTQDPLPSTGLWPAFLSPTQRPCATTWIRSSFSPCGTYVMCGTQKGNVYVWNTDTGLPVASYDKQHVQGWDDNGPIVSIAFHPHDHIFALSTWGEAKSVKVWNWDKDAPEVLLGGSLVSEESLPKKLPPLHFDVEKIVAKSMASRMDLAGDELGSKESYHQLEEPIARRKTLGAFTGEAREVTA